MSDLPDVTEEMLAELDAKAKAATPGPWYAQGICVADEDSRSDSKALQVCTCHRALHHNGSRSNVRHDLLDAAHIAAASPEVVRALVREVRVARKALELLAIMAYDAGPVMAGKPRPEHVTVWSYVDLAYWHGRAALAAEEASQ